MLAQRRKLLQYLRRADFDAYAKMLSALGLKDRYMKQVLLCSLCNLTHKSFASCCEAAAYVFGPRLRLQTALCSAYGLWLCIAT